MILPHNWSVCFHAFHSQVDEINLMPTVTAILAASNIPTFPYVTVEEVQTALEQHDSVGDSSPLDKSIRARVDHTLRHVNPVHLVWALKQVCVSSASAISALEPQC